MSELVRLQIARLARSAIWSALIIAALDIPLGLTVLRDVSDDTASLVGMATAIVGIVTGHAIGLRRMARSDHLP